MRILVVEDDSRMAELLRQGLAEDGHTVTVALNGEDGLAMAQPMTQQRAFDLLLLDIMLPGLSGLEVARRLRARLDRTPILMLMSAIPAATSCRAWTLAPTITGDGIAADALPHLFERFYRADETRGSGNGFGRGLEIAQENARAHGCRITVESERGGSARFPLTLKA